MFHGVAHHRENSATDQPHGPPPEAGAPGGPRKFAPPRCAIACVAGQLVLDPTLRILAIVLPFSVRRWLCREIVCRHLGFRSVRRGWAEGEVVMCHDLGSGFLRDSRCASEMIRMGVRDDHGVDVTRLHADLLQPVLERPPGRWAGETGVDDGYSFGIHDRVAVDVPEPGEADRQRHAQHVGRDFDDFGRGGFLFLPSGHVCTVGDCAARCRGAC